MPVIEFPDIGEKVEVPDGYTDKDIEEIYSTLSKQKEVSPPEAAQRLGIPGAEKNRVGGLIQGPSPEEMEKPAIVLPESVKDWIGKVAVAAVGGPYANAVLPTRVSKEVGESLGGMVESMTSPAGVASIPALAIAPELVLPEMTIKGIQGGVEQIQSGKPIAGLTTILAVAAPLLVPAVQAGMRKTATEAKPPALPREEPPPLPKAETPPIVKNLEATDAPMTAKVVAEDVKSPALQEAYQAEKEAQDLIKGLEDLKKLDLTKITEEQGAALDEAIAANPAEPLPEAPAATGKTETVGEAPAKEPWQMGRDEYRNIAEGDKPVAAAVKLDDGTVLKAAIHPMIQIPKGERVADSEGFVTRKGRYVSREEAAMLTGGDYWEGVRDKQQEGAAETILNPPEEPSPVQTDAWHRNQVERALREGKSVPAKVLADYPDLAKKAPATGEQPPAPLTEKAAEQPQAPSVGAAAKEGSGEFNQPTSLKNASGDLDRLLNNLPEATPTERQAMVPAMERANETLGKDVLAGEKLADEVIRDPRRRLTGDDSALLLRHKMDLLQLKNQAASDTFNSDPAIKKIAEQRFDEYSEKLLNLLDALKKGGEHTGRELRWRQALLFEDYSFETMLRDKGTALDRELKPGDPEWEQVKKLNERIVDLEKQLKEKESKKASEDRTAEADDAFADVSERAETTRKQAKKAGVVRDMEQERSNVIDNLKERFMDSGDLVGSNKSIRKLMEILYEDGYRERVPMEKEVHRILSKEVDPTITLEETQDLMSGYGRYKEPSKNPTKIGVGGIAREILQVRKLLDFWKGESPKKTGMGRFDATKAERDYIKVVNEAKKRFGTISEDPAKALKSALDAIETRLKNRLADLKQEVVTRQKIVKERAPSPYNEETLRLRKEIDEVKKQWGEIFGKTELTDAQKLERAEKAALRQEEELKRQLRTGEIFPKTKITSEQHSALLDATRARIKALEEERYWVRDLAQPKEEPHVKVLRQVLDRLRKQEIQYKEKLAKGDFSKRVKKEQPSSPEILDTRVQLEQAKHEFLKGLNEDRQARWNKWEKLTDASRKAAGASVNITSSFDLSAPRQALFAILSNIGRLATSPTQAKGMLTKPFGEMFRAWADEATARRIEQQIKDRPNAREGLDKAAGVSYTDLETDRFTRYEENAHSVLDKWAKLPYRTGNLGKTIATAPGKAFVKGVRASNRAFITFLNRTRADLFDELLRTNFSDRLPTKTELQHVGELVNLATGRGTLNPKIASTLSHGLWAPRLLASRVQTLAGVPLMKGVYQGMVTKDPVLIKMVAKEYTRVIASAYILGTVAHLFTESGDKGPTSSDYGKIIRGNTRLDIWGGYQQLVVLLRRLASQKTTTLEGETKSTGPDKRYGDDDGWVIFAKFLRSKLRPDLGTVVNSITGSDFTGKPFDLPSALENTVVPLPMRDVGELLRDRGFTEAMILEALQQFGAGVATYEEFETKHQR